MEEGHGMIYTERFQADSRGRLVECPVCKNTKFPDDSRYCIICGMSRLNMCVPERDTYRHENAIIARFCEYCGAKTTFFLQNLLLTWKEIRKEAKKEAPPQTDDEELPF